MPVIGIEPAPRWHYLQVRWFEQPGSVVSTSGVVTSSAALASILPNQRCYRGQAPEISACSSDRPINLDKDHVGWASIMRATRPETRGKRGARIKCINVAKVINRVGMSSCPYFYPLHINPCLRDRENMGNIVVQVGSLVITKFWPRISK